MFGIAAEVGDDRADLLLRAGNAGARFVERVRGAIDLCLRGDARAEQALLAVVLGLLKGERVLGRRELRLALPVVRLQRVDLQSRGGELRARLFDGNAKRRVVEAEQHVAFVNRLVVAHRDGVDATGDVGADGDARGLHVGIVGRFEASAGEIEVRGGGDDDHRPEQHQRKAKASPPVPHGRRLRNVDRLPLVASVGLVA